MIHGSPATAWVIRVPFIQSTAQLSDCAIERNCNRVKIPQTISAISEIWRFSALIQRLGKRSALIRAVSQEISTVQLVIRALSEKMRRSLLKQRCSALIFNSENFRFQCCSRLNQRCWEIFREWTALNQNWNISESKLISFHCLWDVNPNTTSIWLPLIV